MDEKKSGQEKMKERQDDIFLKLDEFENHSGLLRGGRASSTRNIANDDKLNENES